MNMTVRTLWIGGIGIVFLLLAAGCDDQLVSPKEDTTPGDEESEAKGQPNAACAGDDDCMRGGCSGTICQARGAEMMITTCEWREEYACYRNIDCGCVRGQCVWKTSSEFEACLEEKRQGN